MFTARRCPECAAEPGEPHIQRCFFNRQNEVACSPLVEWLAGLPAEYERLKARASPGNVASDRSGKA